MGKYGVKVFFVTRIIDLYVTETQFCQVKKEKNLKFFGAVVFVGSLALTAAYFSGTFTADVDVTVSDQAKKDVVRLTSDTIERTQEETNKVFNKIQEKLNEETK